MCISDRRYLRSADELQTVEKQVRTRAKEQRRRSETGREVRALREGLQRGETDTWREVKKGFYFN